MTQFTQIFKDDTRLGHKISTSEYLTSGKYPIIDQGKHFISGYRNDKNGLYTDIPAIIFGDHTRILKYINVPFFIGADGVKILKPKIDNCNYKYLYYALCNIKIPNTGYNRHFKWLKEANITIPKLNIQNKVVNMLDHINNIIQLREQQLSKLDQLVKSRFIEMFGKIENNSFSWNMVKLNQVIKFCEAGWSGSGIQRQKQENEVAVLKVSSVTKGYFDFHEYKVLNDQKNIKKYIYPQKNDLIFSRANTRELVGATVIIDKDYPKLILPDKLWRIKLNNNINIYYIKYILSDNFYRKKISSISTGTSGSMFNVSMEKFKSLDIPLPPLPLQEQFAAIVQQVDKVKSSVKQSLETLETLKKSLMQEYFG